MRRALPIKAGDLPFQTGFLHQARIARCNGLGQRELVGGFTDVVDRADGAVAGERSSDEPGLALVVLPHGRVHASERGVGVDLHLVVLVALPLDASFALFDVGWQPRHIEMVQRLQPKLGVHTRAHGLR